MEKKYSINFDILRSIAVGAVIIYHFFPSYAPWGFVGVDIFIVLSGFLLERKIVTGQSVYQFLERRFIRIYPPLVLVLFFFLVVSSIMLLRSEYDDFIRSLVAALFAFSNYHEASFMGYFSGVNTFRPLVHTWSLSVEIQFYIFIALSFLIFSNIKVRVIIFSIIIFALLLFSFFFSNDGDLYFSTFARLWEFLLGALFVHIRNRHFTLLSPFLVLGSFSLIIMLVDQSVDYPGILALLPVVFALSFFQIDFSFVSQYFSKFFRFISSISYSLFLLHYPLLSFMNQFKGQLSVADRFVIIGCSVFAAWMVEIVILKRFQRLSTLTGAVGLVVLLALSTVITSEFVNRVDRPVDLRNAFLSEYDGSFRLAPIESCGFEAQVEERCRFPLVMRADVLLLGDSLSHALSPSFDLMVETMSISSYKQLGAGGCPPFLKSSSLECRNFWMQALELIEPNSFKTIVIAGQWPLYFDSLSPDEKISEADGFLNELRQFLDGFNGNVVFVGTPPLGARPRSCFDRVLLFSPSNCNIDYDDAVSRSVSQIPLIDKLQGIEHIKFFDPFKFLCNEINCLVLSDQKLLYLDDSHFSIEGARFLSSSLTEMVITN